MSNRYDETSHLLQQDKRLRTVPYDPPPSSHPSRTVPTGPINHSLGPPARQTRADTAQSEFSTSFGGMSFLGSEANPRDAQELLDNLDRATSLIRRHLQEQPQGGGHV